MNRRAFLKLIGLAPIAPSVLAALPKKELTVAAAREFVGRFKCGGCSLNEPSCSCSIAVFALLNDKWILLDKITQLNYHDGMYEFELSKNAVRGISEGQMVTIICEQQKQ